MIKPIKVSKTIKVEITPNELMQDIKERFLPPNPPKFCPMDMVIKNNELYMITSVYCKKTGGLKEWMYGLSGLNPTSNYVDDSEYVSLGFEMISAYENDLEKYLGDEANAS